MLPQAANALAVFIALGAVTATAVQCERYACSIRPYTNDTCIYREKGVNTLYPCSSPMSFCPTEFQGNFAICREPPEPQVPARRYIGEPCDSESPCLSVNCTGGFCRGASTDSPCSDSSTCDSGLRCYRGLCSPLMAVGAWGCFSDSDCAVTSGCNFIKGRYDGQCTLYYSLGAGAVVTDCDNGRSRLCKSSYCRNGQETPFPRDYCIDAPVSVQQTPVLCQSDEDCGGISRPWEFSGKCVCGFNALGSAYCAPFEGDPAGLAMMESLAALMHKGSGACHTDRRLQADCLKLISEPLYKAFTTRETFFRHYPELQNNDKCVQAIFTSYYWSSGEMLSGTIPLFVALVVSY